MSTKQFGEFYLQQKQLLEAEGINFEDFNDKSQEEKAEILRSLQKEYLGPDKPVNHLKPLVSVCTITYRHAPFIRDYFEGVLMQQTDFPFEIIVCDDGSDDGTAEICREYAEKYPDKIRLYDRIRPLGVVYDREGQHLKRYNFEWCLGEARGKYIALCEGDDYWTDPLKLQKQVDFLEDHPECMLCFHQTIEHKENSDQPDFLISDFKSGYFPIQTLLKDITVHTSSFVFPKSIYETEIYKICFSSPKRITGDMPLLITASTLGKIYGIAEVMSVYRQHGGGFTAHLEEKAYAMCEEAIDLKKIFGKPVRKEMNRRIGEHASMAIYKMRSGKGKEGRKLWWLAFRNAPWSTVKHSTLRFAGFLRKKF